MRAVAAPPDLLRMVLPLLLSQPALWWEIGPAQHELLSQESSPLRPLVVALESILEDQPRISPAGLWEALRAAGHAPETSVAQSPDPLEADDDVLKRDLRAILLRLERTALQRRQGALVEGGLVSDADRAEYRNLALRLREIELAQREPS
jgi:DNA primase